MSAHVAEHGDHHLTLVARRAGERDGGAVDEERPARQARLCVEQRLVRPARGRRNHLPVRLHHVSPIGRIGARLDRQLEKIWSAVGIRHR
ncbi:MAG: hypothetical protein ABW073_07355, partial [Acidimicrobiia bacterium]